MADSATPEYIVHDYSAIDRQIDEIARREAALTNSVRIDNFKRFAIAFLIFAAGLAVIIIAIGIAGRLWNPPETYYGKDPQKLDITLKNEPVQIKLANGSSPTDQATGDINTPPPASMFNLGTDLSTKADNQSAEDTQDGQQSKDGTPLQLPMIEITKFITVPSTETGFKNVITGWRYRDSNKAEPYHQYCYLEIEDELSKSINLAEINGNSPVIDLHSPDLAKKNGISKPQWDRIKAKCRWFNP